MKKAMFLPSGEELLSPSEVASLRMSLAGLLIIPFAFIYKVNLFPKNWYLFLISGVLGNLLPAFLFTEAETEISSSFTAMLNSIVPFFAFIIGLLFFKTQFNSKHLIGLMIGFLGAIGLIYFQFGDIGSIKIFPTALIIIATLCYASNLNMIKITMEKERAIEIAILSLMYVMPFSIGYLLIGTEFTSKMGTENAQIGIFYTSILAFFSTTLALMLFTYLIKISTSVFASSVTYIIPIFALIWGIMDGEEFFGITILFMAIIMSGIYLLRSK